MFIAREIIIATRLQVIEMAQLEDAKISEDIKMSLAHRNTQNKMLLDERAQDIQLDMTIFPT